MKKERWRKFEKAVVLGEVLDLEYVFKCATFHSKSGRLSASFLLAFC